MSLEKVIVECPICYDAIEELKNCVTTECGHQFHCSCLMKNSATNGFSCPMCRSTMAEEEDLSESDEESEYDLDDEQFDDNALTSFRMFHQQLAGEEVEEEEDFDEDEEDEVVVEEIIRPSSETIATILIGQGITMEDMVKCFLIDHEEYDTDLERNELLSDQMFGKLRQIISNYPRRQAQEQQSSSSRLRQREETENCFAQIQNRYHVLDEDDV